MATKAQLEEALRRVREIDGSPDIIAALLSALEDGNFDDEGDNNWQKFLKPYIV